MTYTRRIRCALNGSSSTLGGSYATATSGGNTITATDATWVSMESSNAYATYRAYAAEGFQFYGWMNNGGDYESYSNPYSLTHADTISLTAWFLQVNVCKIVYDANGGTGAPATQKYEQTGTASHTFTISSTKPTKSGYTFARWLDNHGTWRDPGDSVTLSYNETLTLTAYWLENPVITFSVSTGGSVNPNSLSVAYGSTISVSGNTLTVDGHTVTATAASGYQFDSWSNTSGLVTADRTVTASFSAVSCTITASAGSGGSISPSGAVSVSYGGNKSFTVSANSNYRISTVKVDGTNVSGVTGRSSYTYTFSNVTADHTIAATFYYDPPVVYHTITASAGTGGSISPSGSVSVSDGSSRTFTVQADSGYHIQEIRVDGSPIPL